MNHLPFILRSYLDVPWTPATTRRTQVKMPALKFGGEGSRMILQDLSITPLFIVNTLGGPASGTGYTGVCQLNARIGWEGRGYLTEELLPLALQHNTSKPFTPCWKFERPYRLDPGERLRVRIIHRNLPSGDGGYPQTPAFMFHGVRVKDGLPIMLYDSKDTYVDPPSDSYGVVVNLTKSTYNCPMDSSVLIHAASTYSTWSPDRTFNDVATDYAPLIQVYSPSGRPWSTAEVSTNNLTLGVAPPAANNYTTSDWAEGRGWIQPSMGLIELGEKRGWVLNKDQALAIELENPNNSVSNSAFYGTGGAGDGYDLMVAVTLRGCLEDPNA